MSSKSRICGVILAAGASSRMGRDKALLEWPPNATDGQTLISAQIEALRPFTQAIITVAGDNFNSIAPVVLAHGGLIVQNPHPERGQFSSLQIALHEVAGRGYEGAAITLVDSPPLSSESLNKLQTRFERAIAEGMWAVEPEQNGKHGHPLFADRKLIDAFLAAPVTSSARAVKHEHAQYIVSVAVPDAMLTADLNTPAQYAALGTREEPSR